MKETGGGGGEMLASAEMEKEKKSKEERLRKKERDPMELLEQWYNLGHFRFPDRRTGQPRCISLIVWYERGQFTDKSYRVW